MWNPNLDSYTGPKYKRIVKALSDDINTGVLRPNQKLPPNRELAETLSVSLGTVVKALQEATSKGLVQGHIGRGTYVQEYKMDRLIELLSPEGDKDKMDLSLLVPPVFTNDVLKRSLNLAAQELFNSVKLHSLLGYQSHIGNTEQREIFADLLSVYHPSTAENIALCQSSQNALSILLSFLGKPGDMIMTEYLTDPGLLDAAQLYKLKLFGVEMDEYGLIPTAFEEACKKGLSKILYCIPTIQNPTTAIMPIGRRKAIAEIAEAYEITIIENGTLNWLNKNSIPSLGSFAPHNTYFITSFSKALSPSIRLGIIRSSKEKIQGLSFALRSHIWMASPIIAEIVSYLITNGYFRQILNQHLERAGRNQLIAEEILGKLRFKNQPFAYHMWLELPEGMDANIFCSRLKEEGVNTVPASVFSVKKSAAPSAIRLGLNAALNEEQLQSALTKVQKLIFSEAIRL